MSRVLPLTSQPEAELNDKKMRTAWRLRLTPLFISNYSS
jgi:hypothetical protein